LSGWVNADGEEVDDIELTDKLLSCSPGQMAWEILDDDETGEAYPLCSKSL